MEANNNQLSARRKVISALLLVAIAFLLMQIKGCISELNTLHGNSPAKMLHSDTVVKYRFLNKWYALPVPEEQPKDSIVSVIPAQVDTLAILKMFYTEYCYTDTIQDTNIMAVSTIRVFENRIKEHQLKYKLLRPEKETTITNTVEKPAKAVLLAGAAISLDQYKITGAGPEVLFMTKKRQAYGIGCDLLKKQYSVRAYIPLRFK